MSKDVLLSTAKATTWRTELRSWTDMLARLGLSAKYSVYAILYRFKTHRVASDLGFVRSATLPGSTR